MGSDWLSRRNTDKVMMLAVIAFSMSMVGTFLVRSGILTSVHAFAVDPTRGAFILALLAIYVTAAFALFAARAACLPPQGWLVASRRVPKEPRSHCRGPIAGAPERLRGQRVRMAHGSPPSGP